MRLPHGADLPLPAYQSEQAAGLDLIAAVPADAPVDASRRAARALIPTGIAIALPPGTEGQVRPRSGLAARHGVTVLNAPGTIDADYRGEIQVILVNLGQRVVHRRRAACALPNWSSHRSCKSQSARSQNLMKPHAELGVLVLRAWVTESNPDDGRVRYCHELCGARSRHSWNRRMPLLPRKGVLAIAAVIDIALHARGRPVAAKALASRHRLPPRHLEPVLQALVRHGILKGVRGPARRL